MFRVLPLILLLAACAEPPSKEMNQAQGAIDAARAAGAERYAPNELESAVQSLERYEEAVAQKDYRLALSHAIDGRERAQNAAKAAGESRARARGDAERAVAEVNTLLTQARDALRDPAVARSPRRSLQESRAVVDEAEKRLQEARAALGADDYARTMALMQGLAAQLQAALKDFDDSEPTGSGRRRR